MGEIQEPSRCWPNIPDSYEAACEKHGVSLGDCVDVFRWLLAEARWYAEVWRGNWWADVSTIRTLSDCPDHAFPWEEI